jgi:predicted Zn-dependent peptidase
MSSRLFQSVREEKGLAYDVGSYIVDYADAGALVVSAGVDPDRIGPAIGAILGELARLRDEPVAEDELGRSKAYLGGRLELRMEETRHLASWLGGQEALHDRVLNLDQALGELNAVTSAGIHEMARRLIRDDFLRLAAVTPRGRGRLKALETMLRLPGGAA